MCQIHQQGGALRASDHSSDQALLQNLTRTTGQTAPHRLARGRSQVRRRHLAPPDDGLPVRRRHRALRHGQVSGRLGRV